MPKQKPHNLVNLCFYLLWSWKPRFLVNLRLLHIPFAFEFQYYVTPASNHVIFHSLVMSLWSSTLSYSSPQGGDPSGCDSLDFIFNTSQHWSKWRKYFSGGLTFWQKHTPKRQTNSLWKKSWFWQKGKWGQNWLLHSRTAGMLGSHNVHVNVISKWNNTKSVRSTGKQALCELKACLFFQNNHLTGRVTEVRQRVCLQEKNISEMEYLASSHWQHKIRLNECYFQYHPSPSTLLFWFSVSIRFLNPTPGY